MSKVAKESRQMYKYALRRMAWNTDHQDIKKHFAKYGKVTYARVSLNGFMLSQQFGWMTVNTTEMNNEAILNSEHVLDGTQVQIELQKVYSESESEYTNKETEIGSEIESENTDKETEID